MITSTSKDYTFRKVDLGLHPALRDPFVAVQLELGNPVKLTTGHSKAAQNYLRCLMTPLGHYRSNPGYGSDFSMILIPGSIVVAEDLSNLFATESLRVLVSVFDPKGPGIPDDEVIIRAELDNYSVRPGSIQLDIFLYFRNEDTPKSIRLPLILDKAS
jgi:hypothetical protein